MKCRTHTVPKRSKDQPIKDLVKKYKPGEVIEAEITQRGVEKTVEIIAGTNPGFALNSFEKEGRTLTSAVAKRRTDWLASKSLSPLPELTKHCPTCKREFEFQYTGCQFDGEKLEIFKD